jgi:AcrR family transcriptional regulator
MEASPKQYIQPPKRQRASKREAIVQAALELFADKGITETSVPEIAAKAKAAVGTLYCHFASKEELAGYLVCETCEAYCKHIWEGFPYDAPYRRQFGIAWRRSISFALERPHAHAYLRQRANSQSLGKESQKAMAALSETENWIIDRGIASGQLAPLPKAALGAIIHGTARALLHAHFDGQLKLDEMLVSQAEESCWKAVGGGS